MRHLLPYQSSKEKGDPEESPILPLAARLCQAKILLRG
ncbi:hypothetical protein PT7_P044 (plasmid) [Pusillimonas sp. T7-7]|nr:hypothetical protein PT7_P044 [Pusillimonas sp. T7-7]